MTTSIIKLRTLTRTRAPRAILHTIWKIAQLWTTRARQRRHLERLTPELLRDIGITESDARKEANKPFWRD